MGRSLADQDTQENKRHDPGVFLDHVDDGKAEDRDDIGDDGNDDAADTDGHGIVGAGAEHLTHDDDVDDSEASADNHVKYRGKLCAPEAKGVS